MNFSTGIVIIVLLIIVIFSIKSYCKKISSGCCGVGDGSVKKIKPKDMDLENYPYEKIAYISGMTCKNCAARVENAFNSNDGFYARVSLSEKTADVHMKKQVDDSMIREIIRFSGYTAERVERLK